MLPRRSFTTGAKAAACSSSAQWVKKRAEDVRDRLTKQRNNTLRCLKERHGIDTTISWDICEGLVGSIVSLIRVRWLKHESIVP